MTYKEVLNGVKELYFARGGEHIEMYMPNVRVKRLLKSLLATRRGSWVDTNAVRVITNVALRDMRFFNTCQCRDGDYTNCKWRRSYNESYNQPRPTALRVEIMPYGDRCAHIIKPGRIGGHIDDYKYCMPKRNLKHYLEP